MFHKFKEYRDP